MTASSVVPVSEYTAALKKWWLPIAVCAVAGAVLGAVLLSLQGGQYEAEARVEVRPLVIAGDDPNLDITRQVNTTNERAIASSQRVAERALALLDAAEAMGIDDLDDPAVIEASEPIVIPLDEVDAAVTKSEVTVPSDSQILVFTATSGSAERSADLANALARAYLAFREESGIATTEDSRNQLLSREAALIAELDEIGAEIGAAGDNEVRARTLSYRELSKIQELQGIGAKLANINAISVDPGVVLDDAVVPESVSGLPGPVGLVSGLLLGLLAGVAGAYWLDRRDDRFRNPSVELSSMGMRILGDVPVGGGLFRKEADEGLAAINSESAEAYRRVQGSLLFNLDQADKSVILVAGTNNPQSATTVAANLAVAAAQAGRRTLLVGADLRRPTLHERFHLPNDSGLSDVLSGRAHLAGSLQAVPNVKNLRLLSSGSPVDQPALLLQGEGLGRLVDAVQDDYDLVVFEAPPVEQVADAIDLARLCESAVLVIEPRRATRGGVIESIEQLRRVGADVLGTVIAQSTET